MVSALKFNTTRPQSFRDMGGTHVCRYAGRCARCARRVYGIARGTQIIDPDPRGAIPPAHALSSMVASEYDMTGPDVPFCWDCANERGAAVYQECLTIAFHNWRSIAAAAVAATEVHS